MSTPFSTAPFVAGSLTGARAFAPDWHGRLMSPSWNYRWGPGVNYAECLGPALFADGRPHEVGELDCSCGFYSYFTTGGTSYYLHGGGVTGIIEGYGRATVGSRGFRCQKARIVALVDESIPPAWKRLCLRMANLPVVGTAVVVSTGSWWVSAALPPGWWMGSAMIIGLVAWLCVIAGFSGLRVRTVRPEVMQRIRERYPDVAYYRTLRAAVRAHPLSKPNARKND